MAARHHAHGARGRNSVPPLPRCPLTVAFIANSDCGRHDTGWGASEHVGRLRGITQALRNDPELFAALRHVEGRHATPDELGLAHAPSYIQAVEDLARAGGGRLDADTVCSAGSWDAATAAAGCVLDAVDLAFAAEPARGFCAIRPPGHHAVRDAAMGFCLFGNVAIAAHYARRRLGAERVLIVDWDVHHGNGTQALVQHERDIHFVSMHQWPWYPGTGAADDRGEGNVWNIPMAAGLDAAEYVTGLERGIDSASAGFTPDLVLISAGFDCLTGDPLGGFTLEPHHLAAVTRRVVERSEVWCGGRVVSALEGGYVVGRLGDGVVAHLRALGAP